jgi:tetratricopeptide (TPR) repeat protein
VVTALGPARGFLKPQEFVEFGTLVSTHGVVIQPRADDVTAEVSNDKIVLTRPGGLVLSRTRSSVGEPARAGNDSRSSMPNLFTLDPQNWGFDREANFRIRQTQLVAEAAAAEGSRRLPAQLNLARFYLARDLIPEAKGVLDMAASDEQAAAEGTPLLLRAIANVMMGRGADAMKDLTQAAVASRTESVLWRSLALAQQGKWSEAREGFRSLEAATATLPSNCSATPSPRRACRGRSARLRRGAKPAQRIRHARPAPQRDADLTLAQRPHHGGLGRLSEALTFYRTVAESPSVRLRHARGCARSHCGSRSAR